MAADDFPLLPITSEHTLRRIKAMICARPKCVFVASFPKSGTTWMQNIVYQLVSASVEDHAGSSHISSFTPFLEADRSWDGAGFAEPAASLHRELGWCACNTHLLPAHLPAGDARIIYVLREPKDVVCSQWHHFAHMAPDDGGYTGELAAFVEDWLAGQLAFGAWRPHVEAWLAAARGDARVLLVRYEDLKADLPAQLGRIAKHLAIELDEERLRERVLPRLTFGWMKAHAAQFEPRSVRWVERRADEPFHFLRKGQVGDAPNLLLPGMLERVDAATAPTVARINEHFEFGRR